MISEILESKKEFIEKFLSSIEGKEGKSVLNLKDVEIDVKKSKLKINGKLEISFSPSTGNRDVIVGKSKGAKK